MLLRLIRLLFLLLILRGHSAYALYFRSFTSGNWNVASTWESSIGSGGPWAAAAAPPAFASDNTITILGGHTVRINTATTIDEVVVDPGATLIANCNGVLTINNGTGVDLSINGTFIDSVYGTGNSCTFSSGAKWEIINGANLIKCTASSSNNWQDGYNTGISNIPSGANWIIRKVGTLNPALSTTNSSQVYYPNLIYENYTGATFVTAVSASSYFNGNTSYPIIKGNFDIGGAGSNYVDFTSNDLNPTIGVQVRGDVLVRSGNAYRNIGTGTEIYGNLTVDGSWSYDNNDARKLIFSNSSSVTINGSGVLNIHNMEVKKGIGNTVTLNRQVIVDVLAIFTSGKIVSSAANLFIMNIGATTTMPAPFPANNASFVDGPCKKLGNEGFVFPVGKGADMQPIGILASATLPSSTVFWTEDFNNGCTGNCTANGYTGPNGAWSVANVGTNGNRANNFFVSCAENGNAPGTCGSGCGGDATLHVGATACPTCTFCPGGDCGATYDTVVVSGNDPTTDIRVISPPINTFFKTTLVLNYKYFEGGDAIDNAVIEYSTDNGISWSSFNIGKTNATCIPRKGRWTTSFYAFPATCNNLSNFRFAFRWTNNAAAGTGQPFSFAIDDISLSGVALDAYTAEYYYTNPTAVYNATYNPSLTHVSRMEYWTLARETGSTQRKVSLYWDSNSGGVTSLPDLRVANFNGTAWDDKGNTVTTGTTAAGTITSDSVTGVWDAFTLGSVIPYPGNPLPVELLSFRGEKKGSSVFLQWTTASEKNNDYFTLQKSPGTYNFAEIAKVKGAGTTNSFSNYDFTDQQPFKGLNYYKLLQTDYDGTVKEEGTVALRFDISKMDAIIIPDMPGQQINIQFTEVTTDNLKLDLIDATGKLIFEKELLQGEISYSVKMNHIANGIYMVRIISGNNFIFKRFSY